MQDIYYTVAHRSQEEIDSFNTRYQHFNTSLITPIFQSSLNYSVVDWKQSDSWGSSHVIYFVRVKEEKEPLVLRANLGFNKVPEYMMKAEQLLTDKVISLGIPTNEILYVDITRKQFPFDFQIQKKLGGNDLEKDFRGSKADYDKMSFDLGSYIAKYSCITFEKFGRFDSANLDENLLRGTKNSLYEYIVVNLDDDIDFLRKADVLNKEKSEKVRKLFDEYKPMINDSEHSLVHHDLADHNIFYENSKITGIFDWEACVIADPCLDLASCPTWRTHYPREELLIKGFESIKKLPDNYKDKMDIFRLRTMLWKIRYTVRLNILNESRKQKFLDTLIPFKLN